jgi:hypothetical protein
MSQEVGPISPARLIEILGDYTTNRGLPIPKASIFNTAVLADTNFLSSDLSPTNTPTLFRIYICLSTSGVFSVRRSKGGVTVAENLNSGNPLLAGCAYMFDILVDSGETVNFQTTVAGTVLKLSVIEKDWGQ